MENLFRVKIIIILFLTIKCTSKSIKVLPSSKIKIRPIRYIDNFKNMQIEKKRLINFHFRFYCISLWKWINKWMGKSSVLYNVRIFYIKWKINIQLNKENINNCNNNKNKFLRKNSYRDLYQCFISILNFNPFHFLLLSPSLSL